MKNSLSRLLCYITKSYEGILLVHTCKKSFFSILSISYFNKFEFPIIIRKT